MDCVFIRHGIALEPQEWDGPEKLRPLTEKGKKRVRKAAAGLASMNLTPTHLLSSPFTRAKDTAAIIRSLVCPGIKVETVDELAVGATPEQLLDRLRTLPVNAVVLCVGHEPLLGETAGFLLCGRSGQRFPMKKAGAALVYLPGRLAPGEGQLRWWIEPAQLRVLGKSLKKSRAHKHLSDD